MVKLNMSHHEILTEPTRSCKKAVELNKRPRFDQSNHTWALLNLIGGPVAKMSTVVSTLLQRVASGDPDAMEECLTNFGGLVWRIVSVRCLNRSDAEDVVQDVFLDLWKSAARFDPFVASESTFVAMIARRRVIDHQRKKQRSLSTTSLAEGAEGLAGSSTGNLREIEVSDEALKARRLMSELKTEEQSVLRMSIDEGLSQSQIAEKTKLPLGTVKTHARRGLLRLRKLLTGQGGGQ